MPEENEIKTVTGEELGSQVKDEIQKIQDLERQNRLEEYDKDGVVKEFSDYVKEHTISKEK